MKIEDTTSYYNGFHEAKTPLVKDLIKLRAKVLKDDMVNHPPHYNNGSVECIDGIQAALGDGFQAYCRGNAIKYIWRADYKGTPVEDIKKAIWYLNKSIEEDEPVLPF